MQAGPSNGGAITAHRSRRSIRIVVPAFLFALIAVLAMGTSAAAIASDSVTTITVPGAPTALKATPGNGAATFRWTAPKNNGGSPITGYTVATESGRKTCVTPGSTSCTVNDLVNGRSYTFRVRARNAKGLGAASAGVLVTAGVPLAPTGVKAIGGYGEATVRWSAPANNGGAITRYSVISKPGSKTCTTTGAKTCTVHSLTNGTTYTFRVTATNARGTGAASTSSASVVPPVIRTIPDQGGIFAIFSDSTHVWMVNLTAGTVTELDASDGSFVQTISGFGDPDSVSSDGTHVWVVNSFDRTVTELDASDGSFVQTIPVSGDALGISSDGTHVWIAGDNSPGTVTELDASDGSFVRTIAVGPFPDAISSDGTHVWVANSDQITGNSVTELDASDGSVVRTIPVGTVPDGVSSDGTHVWVANGTDATVTEIDATDGSVLRTIPVDGDPSAISSDGTHVWVADNAVTEIDASDGSVIQTIHIGGGSDAVSSDGVHVWAAADKGVAEIAA